MKRLERKQEKERLERQIHQQMLKEQESLMKELRTMLPEAAKSFSSERIVCLCHVVDLWACIVALFEAPTPLSISKLRRLAASDMPLILLSSEIMEKRAISVLLSYKENIMPTKDELETKLYEKMSQENEAFLAEMKTQSPDEIISHAYEIACRDNLLMLFEDETSLSERQLTVLNEFEHPLSQLYTDWLSRDTDEMDAFRDSIACCADDILRKRVEEKYRDPAQPIYPNTRSEAMARGEVFEWMASRDRTLTCAGTFEKDATNAYNDGKLPAFLKEWTNTYGKDRCMFVLACTMRQRTGDERFYPPARQAAGRFAALQKQMGGHTDVYAVDNHSCVINAAMEQLAKPERSVERKAVKKDAPER